MEIEVSPMTISDLDSIGSLLQEKFDPFWSYSVFKQELQNPNSCYIVAKQGDEVIGFGGIWKAIDEIHITNLVTRIDKRSLGIGNLLLKQLIQMAKIKNVTSVTLEVNIHNLAAIHLYEKNGFVKLGVRKNYYSNHESAIIMTLTF